MVAIFIEFIMQELQIADLIVFLSVFLGGSVVVHYLTKRFSLPYTIIIFGIGLLIQTSKSYLPFQIHFSLSTDTIFFVLLPFLLFESALHIKFHQFRIQFKTISFISTFGLLFSIFTIGFLLPIFIGLPLPVALLFGAIISATDPVAVLALFKTLPVPHRLALLVDGESMLNDGTGVIAFKLVSTFVLGGVAFSSGKLAGSLGNFMYVFLGAMILGVIVGYITSRIIKRVRTDKVASTTITIAAALGSFVLAEHFLHVSGVITTVITGLLVGNLATVRMNFQVRHFIEEMWDYISFLANTLVFFFIGYIFQINEFLGNPAFYLLAVFVVLLGRVATTYISYGITNVIPGFRDEQNVPLRWQHLINWGGLRATIPILLVFTLPDSYQYKEVLTNLTLATVLFTLAINGTTSAWLLKKLGLHLPSRDEEIIEKELAIFHAEESKEKLHELESNEFDKILLNSVEATIQKREEEERDALLKIVDPKDFLKSLKKYAIAIERHRLEELLEENHLSEDAYFEFEAELDLQEDALERVDEAGYRTSSHKSFRRRLLRAKAVANAFPLVKSLIGFSPEAVILNRYQLLKARIITSEAVLSYFLKVKRIISDKKLLKELDTIVKTHNEHTERNRGQMLELKTQNKDLIEQYQLQLISKII